MTHTSFSDQVHDLWRTKPVRLPRRGPIAGVAAGFAQRYNVDPVLVRVAFVVSTLFGGAGLVLYLVGWVILEQPDRDGRVSGRRVDSPVLMVVLIAALVIAALAVGPVGAGLGGSGLVSISFMLGAWWLLYLRQPVPPPLGPDGLGVPQSLSGYAGYSPSVAHHQTSSAPVQYHFVSESSTAAAGFGDSARAPVANSPDAVNLTKAPPSWDPLGAAPFAWDLPEPAPAPAVPVVAPRRPRSRWTPVVAGLAILGAAGGGIAAMAGAQAMTPGRIGAIALAILGLGMLAGAFVRRGFGLVALAVPVALFVWVASLVLPGRLGPANLGESVRGGEQTWTINSENDLHPLYTVIAGSGELDLRGMKLTRPDTVSIDVRAGEMILRLPQDMQVQFECDEVFGDAICPASNVGDPGKPVLTVNADVRFGSMEVHRG